MKWKKIEEQFFKALMILSTVAIVASFFLIVGTIVSKGLPSLSWEMLSEIPTGDFYMGGEGGILNSIVGSMYIAVGSSLLALLISLPVVIYINLYLKKSSWMGNLTRLGYDVLFGMPSIVYGAFGFTLMIYLGMKASLLGGIIAVTLLIIPIMVRTMDEVVRSVPKELFEASYSLGATRYETAFVLLKQVAPGIFTAILLAFGRGIGDVASVMFTAGFSNDLPQSLQDPASTLPLAVFNQLSSPVEEVQARAYGAALILTIVVLLISISARMMSKRLSKNKI
jgi:phosphate transport system permease protein